MITKKKFETHKILNSSSSFVPTNYFPNDKKARLIMENLVHIQLSRLYNYRDNKSKLQSTISKADLKYFKSALRELSPEKRKFLERELLKKLPV